MPYPEFPFNGPILPDRFHGRTDIIEAICQHVAMRTSVSLVGGPLTGGDSLLAYLASEYAEQRFPQLKSTANIHVSALDLGGNSTSNYFWRRTLHDLKRQIDDETVASEVAAAEIKSSNDTLDVFALEDLFDNLADAGCPVLLAISDLQALLDNPNFWPPNDFFHIARSLARRPKGGIVFVTTTPRPLLDFWHRTRNASPFYSIFTTIPMGRLDEKDAREILALGFESLHVELSKDLEDFIIIASERHPCLLNYIASMCIDLIRSGKKVNQAALEQKFLDPESPAIMLARRVNRYLTTDEKRWLKALKENPRSLTEVQTNLLSNLWKYGLTPPGTVLR